MTLSKPYQVFTKSPQTSPFQGASPRKNILCIAKGKGDKRRRFSFPYPQNVFLPVMPAPRRVRKHIFWKEKKMRAQRTFPSPKENVRRGLPPHFQLKLQSVKLPKMWFFSFLVHPVYYADAIFSWKVCIVSFSNCFCNLISSDVMSI